VVVKYRLLDLLVSEDEKPFRLEAAVTEESQDLPPVIDEVACSFYCAFKDQSPSDTEVEDCRRCYSQDVVSGRLVSESGATYEIREGVPRLIPEDVLDEGSQSTFSMEWKYSDDGLRNWGEPMDVREEKFFNGTGITPDAAKNMLMLDAGCGSGLLDRHLSGLFGLEILAFDQSSSPFQIEQRKKEPLVYPIQASVLQPPVRPESMDLVYSAGVLMTTRDTKQAFDSLVPLVREGGLLYVWVYHPIDRDHYPTGLYRAKAYHWLGRNVTSRLSHTAQELLYSALSVPLLAKQRIEFALGHKTELLTRREKMQALVDQFSPRYAWRHSEEEVRSWFEEAGFTDIEGADHGPYGFGVRGVRA
jgi:SAM-dependent methyltransferase